MLLAIEYIFKMFSILYRTEKTKCLLAGYLMLKKILFYLVYTFNVFVYYHKR